ncbi:MAG: T9SS type A sorting domain-containing protein [Ignavibacteriales bacterium]|nr:T9SS type A sorting domain-containing protein [Ignavibacteriales bacterium]MCF8435818.1 T9SS type A sorting domain-containing protein [Ignavibacteriales bacterium]
MKKIFYLLFILAITAGFSFSQVAVVEEFNYTAGDTLTQHGWVNHSGTGNFIVISSGSLSYPGYVSSNIGNMVEVNGGSGSREDVTKIFNADSTAGTVYASVLVRVDSATATGDYFFHLKEGVVTSTNFRGRLFVKDDGTGTNFVLGISKASSSTVTYSTVSHPYQTTLLVVLKATFVEGASNDLFEVFINPDPNSPEPAADIASTDVNSDFVLASVALRQGTQAYQTNVDGIRVAYSWRELFELPMSGNYYVGSAGTGPNGSDPYYPTLGDAFNALNSRLVGGDCMFYITSNINEPNTGGKGIGLAVDAAPYTVTFKPYMGTQPVITLNYPSDGNSGPSGALLLGIPTAGGLSWDSLRTTTNIVFDGSNTTGGSTRDLTIESAPTAVRNAIPMLLVGDVSNVEVKNCNIYYKVQTVSTSGNLFLGSIVFRSRNYLSQDWVPHNILVENNHLKANFDGNPQNAAGIGSYQTGTPLPASYPYNITVKNNVIEGKRRGMAWYRMGSADFYNNEIILNQDIASAVTNEAVVFVDFLPGSVFNFYGNKITQLSSITNAASSGATAISVEAEGTFNIYNNMIYGFALSAANPTAYLRGIRVSHAAATANIYFNSIYMVNLPDIGTGAVTYQGLYFTDGIATIKNNSISCEEADFTAYPVYRSAALGTFVSDYNNYNNPSGNVGFFDAASALTLADWQTLSGQDVNSISADPDYVSASDLHLQGTFSALMGKGIAIDGITTDIDNQLRDTPPEIGADEIPGVIPVELVSFGASVSNNNVSLTWKTATETNSASFVIERKNNVTDWTSVGTISAAGYSTEPVSYSFSDENVASGLYNYRLKQIDFDGSFAYSSIIEVNVGSPTSFSLSQNYPNPFNPTTTIDFVLAADAKTRLEIFNALGESVSVIVNEFRSAGTYSEYFDASNLASGTYIYRLTAGQNVMTKKMLLIK